MITMFYKSKPVRPHQAISPGDFQGISRIAHITVDDHHALERHTQASKNVS